MAFSALVGCSNELDGKVDESKLPPMPKNGGPQIAAPASAGGPTTSGNSKPVGGSE